MLGKVADVGPAQVEQDQAVVENTRVVGPTPDLVVVELVLEGIGVENARAVGPVVGGVGIEHVEGGVAVQVAEELQCRVRSSRGRRRRRRKGAATDHVRVGDTPR